jgi:hypothetical protein
MAHRHTPSQTHTQKASLRIHGSKTEGEMKLKVEKGATNSMREEWYRGMV